MSQSNIIHTKKFVMNFTVKIKYLKKGSTDFTAKKKHTACYRLIR